MDRLTVTDEYGFASILDEVSPSDITIRLANYEDTGLSPAEIVEMMKENERMRQLIADKYNEERKKSMKYTEQKGDLFAMPNDYALAHCISADFVLGAGIAVAFAGLGVRNELRERYTDRTPDNFKCGYCLKTVEQQSYPVVYNLVTKSRCYYKPTYQSLTEALTDMRKQMIADGVKKLAIPRIGCGLDGLEWSSVSTIVKEIFKDTDIEIVVCAL